MLQQFYAHLISINIVSSQIFSRSLVAEHTDPSVALRCRRWTMPKYSPKMKLCATGVRWAGVRSTDPTRAFVSTHSPTTKGECM
ncbi:MAG: hypothetical protein RIA63_13125, partial [Cyclobacteriaceae bacterium]